MFDKKVILIGYSGHAYVVVETAVENSYDVIGYSDKEKSDLDPYCLPYLGFEKKDDFIGWQNEVSFVLGIGDNTLRQNIAHLIESKGKTVETIIHKTANISKSVVGTEIKRTSNTNKLSIVSKHLHVYNRI